MGFQRVTALWPPEAKSPDNPAEGGFPFCLQQLWKTPRPKPSGPVAGRTAGRKATGIFIHTYL
jgi:hypothetical protein